MNVNTDNKLQANKPVSFLKLISQAANSCSKSSWSGVVLSSFMSAPKDFR